MDKEIKVHEAILKLHECWDDLQKLKGDLTEGAGVELLKRASEDVLKATKKMTTIVTDLRNHLENDNRHGSGD